MASRLDVNSLQQNFQPFDIGEQFIPQPKKKKTGLGGFLSSLISEGGGLGGAAGGAALGTALLPGIGTVLGAGLGGFLGETGGSVAEQKIRDNKVDLGKALKEGAIGGVASAGPLKLLKGAGAATKAIATGEKALPAASEAVTSSLFSRLPGAKGVAQGAQRLESRAGGYGQGTKIPGGDRLTNSQVAAFRKFDKTEGIPAAHPDIQGKVIEEKLNEANKGLDNLIKTADRKLTPAEQSSIPKAITAKINANRAIKNDPAVLKEAQQLIDSHGDIKSIKEAVKAKRDIQKEINFNRNSASPVPGKEQANRIALSVLDDFINSKGSKEIGLANKRVSQFIKRQDLSLGESANLTRQSTNAGGGLLGRVITGDTAQGVKSKAGRLTGDIVGDTTGQRELPTTKNFAGRILAGRAADLATSPQDEQTQVQDAFANPEGISPDQSLGATGQPTDTSGTTDTSNPFDPANAQAAVQQILAQGGDMKDVATYLANVKAMQELSGGSKPLGSTQQQQANNALSGLQSIQDIQNEIANNPSVVNKSGIPGQGSLIGGFESKALGTGSYNAAISNVRDVISRLRSGAALNAQEEKTYTNLLPKAGDSPDTINYKLSTLGALLSRFANPQGSGTDVQDLLSSAGAQ